jgi:Rv0078B-related antitoxin
VATPADEARLVENLRIAFDLYEAGVEMMRQNLRRRFPGTQEAEIDARLSAWLHERPGAELGDAPGEAVTWPPRRRR